MEARAALTVDAVRIREVGPRDGLQVEAPLSVEDRIRLIEALVAAGLKTIEAVAFVSPKAVPSMADAEKVVALLPKLDGVTWVGLVPNRKGAEMALDAGLDAISVTLSASEGYNQRNVRMSVDDSIDQLRDICGLAGEAWVEAVLSCSFGSPYEGDIAPSEVAAVARRCMDAGATALTLADTTGMATPRRIEEVLAATGTRVGLHLHDTRGTALLNAHTAYLAGVRDFDTAVGGLGGSPFAEGATGNLATEDLVYLMEDLGVETGVDLDRLLDASRLVAELVGHPVPSRVAAAGPRLNNPA
ncbi:MAG: hydroxymethylglutaryl-CoA lyase [Actinobacteria bacterium]|nr:hydroxymethylglutaryl-CoA lyase [Actinomycetota bacterium]